MAELTRLEVQRREKDDAASLEWLEERRLHLSEMLGTFLKQEKEREQQTKDLVIKMDQQVSFNQCFIRKYLFEVPLYRNTNTVVTR